jgi:cobalamin biosynthesis Mg chelatase CobN
LISDEWLRVIGNGVPVPLAAAYGDALFESLLPLVKEKPRNDVWAELWEETGGNALRAQKAPDEDGSPARESQEAAAASLSLQRRHAARTTTSSSSSSSSSSGHSSVLTTVTTPLLTSSGPTNENGAQVKAEEEEDQGGAESSDSDIEIVSGPGVARSTPDAQNRRARAPPTRYGVLELSSDSD